jgi:hypothetical protein
MTNRETIVCQKPATTSGIVIPGNSQLLLNCREGSLIVKIRNDLSPVNEQWSLIIIHTVKL